MKKLKGFNSLTVAIICAVIIVILLILSFFPYLSFTGAKSVKDAVTDIRKKAEEATEYIRENVCIILPYENGNEAVLTVTFGKYSAYLPTKKAATLLKKAAELSINGQKYLPEPLCIISEWISGKLTSLSGCLYHPEDAFFS